MVPALNSAGFFVNGGLEGAGGGRMLSGLSTTGTFTGADRGWLDVGKPDGDGEFTNTPKLDALDGLLGETHPQASDQSLDMVFSSSELWTGRPQDV